MAAERSNLNHRYWRDLSKWKLWLALVLAPVPPVALGELLLTVMFGEGGLGMMAGILAAAEIWSMLIGMAYLVLARRRGFVRRIDCLLLGAFLAFSLPAVAMAGGGAVDWILGTPDVEAGFIGDSDPGPSDGAFAVILGVLSVPFGMLGGWAFWRIGVRPAPMRTIDVAPKFD
jgi:hypothetical protein